MNNLAYMGQDGQTVAPKVQELLGKELASNSPIHFAVESEGAGGASARSVLTDVATSLFGGKVVPLFTIHFDIVQPRAILLDVHMLRQGLGCIAGSLAYATTINKGIGGEVSFGDDGKFAGDAAVTAKLNSTKGSAEEVRRFCHEAGRPCGQRGKDSAHFADCPAGEWCAACRRNSAPHEIDGLQRILWVEGIFGDCRPSGSHPVRRCVQRHVLQIFSEPGAPPENGRTPSFPRFADRKR